MDDGIGAERDHGIGEDLGVEDIGHDGLGSEPGEQLGLCRGSGQPRHLMAGLDEKWNQTHPDHPAGACDKDPHPPESTGRGRDPTAGPGSRPASWKGPGSPNRDTG